MRKLRIILTLAGLAVAQISFGQQLPQYTQYLFNDFALNPSIAGARPHYEARSNHRYQWVGFTDAPRTFFFSLNGPIGRSMGLGGYLFTDRTGPTTRTGIHLSYAYHFKLGENTRVSLGISAGAQQFAIDGSKIKTEEQGDIALSSTLMSVVTPDAGTGIYLYDKREKFFVSLSAPQLLAGELGELGKVQFFDDYPNTQSTKVNHFYAAGGYKFSVSDEMKLQPAVIGKYVIGVDPQADASLIAYFRDKFWMGCSYRVSYGIDNGDFVPQAITPMFGFKFENNLMFGYSFDIDQSEINPYQNGSHELMLGIQFQDRKGTRVSK